MKKGRAVLGTLVALTIGAIGGMLFAPKKGSKSRKLIMEKGDHSVDELKSKFNKISDSLTEKIKSTKKYAEDLAKKKAD